MRALFIQPDATEEPGLVGEALVGYGFELDTYIIQPDLTRTEGSTDFPPLGGHDLVVVTGSPWSVFDEEVSSWVTPLVHHIRSAIEADVPILGICFGAQAMSVALGGVVERSNRSEFGWVDIDSTVGPLCGPWFEFHQDVFSTPEGAEELAANEVGPQAFRVGRSLAVQFHPEISAGPLLAWYDSGEEGRLQHAGFDTQRVLDDTIRLEDEARLRVRRLIDWFVEEIAKLP